MTPIQTHEAELRAMMERAGLNTFTRIKDGWFESTDGFDILNLYQWHGQVMHRCAYRKNSGALSCDASHPDPRIARRHCLEMAGLLTDRPPQTDAELVQWLTERAGPADFMDRWFHGGYTIRRFDHVWVYWHQDRPLERSIYARELGAILWCAERFPEVKP